jgi:DNA-binding XRE family transcriptional regulator
MIEINYICIMINIIYGLRDPRNDVYQYIGKSTVGSKRALKHLTESHSPKVNEWIEKLSENWLYPIVDIIEEVENLDDLAEREEFWINHYHYINPDLLNIMLVEKPLNKTRTTEDEAEFNFLVSICYRMHEILKKERLFRNITQEEMANEMGVSRSAISECENGANVSMRIINKYIITLKGIDIVRKTYNQRTSKKK